MRTRFATKVLLTLALAGLIQADNNSRTLSAKLTGFQEVPPISTVAKGTFKATINQAGTELQYEEEYSGLEAPVTQSHIHFGQKSVAGGIMIWLCGTAALPGPAGTPTCPDSGRVSRTVTAADVVGPSGQGVSAGEFAEALRAIRAGQAYANVHSTKFPGGEIRGQIRGDDED
jgi:CHRD domain-containing protein